MFNPVLSKQWSEDHYGRQIGLLGVLDDLVPLIVFEGDVGTGKSVLGETIGSALNAEHGYTVYMTRMSTQVRGTGYVGEMGSLLAGAFAHVEQLSAKKGAPVIFVVDEADSLLSTRTMADHHHEDKSGVNTILQHLDALRSKQARVAVIAITNRMDVLDPAVRRRAMSVISFERPGDAERAALFELLLRDIKPDNADIERLVAASQPKLVGETEVPFSYSDLTLKVITPSLRSAIHDNGPLSVEDLEKQLRQTEPSPRMTST